MFELAGKLNNPLLFAPGTVPSDAARAAAASETPLPSLSAVAEATTDAGDVPIPSHSRSLSAHTAVALATAAAFVAAVAEEEDEGVAPCATVGGASESTSRHSLEPPEEAADVGVSDDDAAVDVTPDACAVETEIDEGCGAEGILPILCTRKAAWTGTACCCWRGSRGGAPPCCRRPGCAPPPWP